MASRCTSHSVKSWPEHERLPSGATRRGRCPRCRGCAGERRTSCSESCPMSPGIVTASPSTVIERCVWTCIARSSPQTFCMPGELGAAEPVADGGYGPGRRGLGTETVTAAPMPASPTPTRAGRDDDDAATDAKTVSESARGQPSCPARRSRRGAARRPPLGVAHFAHPVDELPPGPGHLLLGQLGLLGRRRLRRDEPHEAVAAASGWVGAGASCQGTSRAARARTRCRARRRRRPARCG